MLENAGDEIAFVGDDGFWPFPAGKPSDLEGYADMTSSVIDALIAAGILEDHGRQTYFDDEPEVYCRLLKNVWG